MDRTAVINTLIEARGYERYLEIGCQADITFSRIEALVKVGVDPATGGTLRMTSDEFFSMAVEPFDVIFIDGNHHHDQVFRDICNSLKLLRPGGVIVMHDCMPPTPEYESVAFCYTAWRAYAKTRERLDLESFVGDFDFGVGILRKATNSAPITIGRSMDALTYADMVANRSAWMRPITPDQVVELANLDWAQWSS